MFTEIIEDLGTITSVAPGKLGHKLSVITWNCQLVDLELKVDRSFRDC